MAVIVVGVLAGKNADTPVNTNDVATPDLSAQDPPLPVSAPALLAAYEENEVAANAKYKNKRLIVSAHIKSIEAGMGDRPYLSLAGGHGQFEIASPQARMAWSEDAAVAKLRKGQAVKLLCVGDSELAGIPMLKDCVLQ